VADVVIAVVVMLGILIVLTLVHELGHFFVAKKSATSGIAGGL
jgi:membrane-associated protease RseP (regulator of RpoE activity)